MKIASAAISIPAALLLTSCSNPPSLPSPAFDQSFWSVWGDGQAELAAYDLKQPRYRQSRTGVAVTIFVTETFSNSVLVKADPGRHSKTDEFPVMKLNFIKEYQTGVYNYKEMLSAFSVLTPMHGRGAGSLTKVSFSSQEWCGHVYGQLLFDPGSLRFTQHSYFDGEADRSGVMNVPSDAISEDALFLWARGFAQPALKSGETRRVPILLSLERSRASHKPLQWHTADLSRSALNETAERFTAKIDDGFTRTFDVERASPHRILKWESSVGESAQLLSSDRFKYWEMNQEGGESALSRLGLTKRPPRTP